MSPTLATLVHDQGIDPGAPAVERRAVRAVVLRDGRVLVLRTRDGALKFPGGGVEPGESDEQALVREIDEECGLRVTSEPDPLGDVVELATARDDDGCAVFRMTSAYFRCEVAAGSGRQRLSEGEVLLGLRPAWVDLAEAVAGNRAALADGPRFVRRELLVLELLAGRAADGTIAAESTDRPT